MIQINNATKCLDCSTPLEVINQVYQETVNNKLVSIKNVPLGFCNTCGKMYYTKHTASKVNHILDNGQDEKFVYDYAKI